MEIWVSPTLEAVNFWNYLSGMGEHSSGALTLEVELVDLPDSLLLEVFFWLPAQSLGCVARTCSRFYQIVKDELLWRAIFRRDFKVPRSVSMHPMASSWRSEYRRLLDESPAVLCEELTKHKDQVLHVSFSHNGEMFATSSKDGKIMVWNATDPCSLRFCANMTKEFSWRYTQFSQFNKSDTLLLVSGVHHGNMTTSGEIAVFDLEVFEPQCRVANKPYDVFGTWYDDHHLFSGSLYWTGHLQSISALWLNKASQAIESERESVMMNLYRFSNVSASSIRTIMVANVPVISEEVHPSQPAPGCKHALCTDCGRYLDSVDSEQGQDDSYNGGEENSNNNCKEFCCSGSIAELERVCIEQEGEDAVGVHEDSNAMDWDEVLESNVAVASVIDGIDSNKRSSLALADGASSSQDASGSLNHSPAKSKCYHNLDDSGSVACAVDYLPPAVTAGLSSLRCCCRGKNTVSSPRVQSASRSGDACGAVKKKNDDQARFFKPKASVSQSADTLSMPPSSSPPTADPQGYHPHKQVTDIPRTNSAAGMTEKCAETGKLLIFTMGEETYTPHLIGIKRIRLQDIRGEEEGAEVVGWPEGDGNLLPNVDQNFQGMDRPPSTVDHTINMHGHIVGMALSPDQRYLYVNSRQWPANYHIEKVLEPPPIAQEIDIHVIDLLTFQEVGTIMRSHKAFTPNDECFFLFLDVSNQYVASGAENKRGYLWDRHYGVHLRCFDHSDVVNSVAFNPRDQEMLVTVSDDYKIKVWRSRRRVRELHSDR